MKKGICKALGFALASIAVLFAIGCAQPSSGGSSGGGSTTHDNGSGGTYTAPSFTGAYYPADESTTAYSDGILAIKFDATPTIGTTGTVKIYKADGTLVDTINPANETYVTGINSNGAIGALNVKNQLIQVSGNTVVIKPHTDSSGYTLLQPETAYYVTIDNGLLTGKISGVAFAGITVSTAWNFTTRAAPTGLTDTIDVSTTDDAADFYSIQGALNYIRASGSTSAWTINVSAGEYLERLYYYGTAAVTLAGPAGNDLGDTARVYWYNLDAWNSGSRMRSAFLWQGGNLNLQNMTFVNTCDRSVEGTNGTQAEAFYFDSTAYLTAYNCSFISHQDTLLIGNNGGRAWFYDCYIEGDTDFIWGYAAVALFENCELRCVRDTAITGQKSYIFASRTPTSGAINKGFVLMNSTITIDADVTAYYGRNSGADTTAAVFNNAFSGSGTLASSLWGGSGSAYTDVAGDCTLGYKDFNNTMNGTLVNTSSRLIGCYALSQAVYDREYNGRAVILNRGASTSTGLYATGTKWDISAYETAFSATTDASTNNVFVEPVYVKNLVGGTTKTFTATAYDGNTSFTWSIGDASIASVDASGIVTAAVTTGSTKVIATSGTSGTGYATVAVIPAAIEATSLSLSSFTTSVMQVNDAVLISAAYTPTDTTDTSTTWTSSDTNVLTVTGTGATALIRAVGTGTATITAASTMYTGATSAVTGTITVSNDGLSIGTIPSGGYTFKFRLLDSSFGTYETFLAGTAYTNTTNLNAYNVGYTDPTSPMSGKYLQLMQKSKAASLSAVNSLTPSTSSYFRMKNNGFSGSVSTAGVVTMTAFTYTVGTDWLLLHNVNVPAAGVTITVNEAKASSAIGRAIGFMVVDPAATGTVAYTAAKGYKLDPNSTTVPYAHTYSYVPAAAETVDIVIMGTNDIYLGDISIVNN